MQTQPYLFFEGRCEEALEFYRKALGAEVRMMLRYKEAPAGVAKGPDGSTPPADKVMHTAFRIGTTELMASDGLCSGKPSFQGFALSVDAKDDADAKRKFDALGAGGQVRQPLSKTFFASSFGMVADKFGVGWMVIATP